jgi:hypothetical protein
LISGRTWCAATECRRHKGRVYRAERGLSRRSA